jgi:dynein heavy chain
MDGFKKSYAEITKKDVSNFKEELKEIYEAYKANGPGSDHVTLEEGVELLNRSKEQNKMFNRRREDLVLAEKLFNLPISKFPELIEMEELNKQYDEIYGIFKEH